MTTYRLTPAARLDLSEIWDYTQERWGAQQAEIYVREIQAAIERVADDPRRGRDRDDVAMGYRSYAIGSHAIFYRTRSAGVDVIRILHQRMDPSRHV